MSSVLRNGWPLLGRDAEIEPLVSLVEGVRAGGDALVLHGEPGIGKSRLLAVAAAGRRGWTGRRSVAPAAG